MTMNILDFLLEHDIDLVSSDRIMTADCMYKLSGEFTVYEHGGSIELIRTDDFDEALKWLEGNE